MHRLDERIDLRRLEESRLVALGRDIDHTDAVVGVEHGDTVRRANVEPVSERLGVTGMERMQDEWRQGEVVDEVDPRGDLHLEPEVRVDLDQQVHATLVRFRAQLGDELEAGRKHEARGAALLDGVADGVETNELHAVLRQPIEHRHQIGPAGRVVDVDVDLLGREGRPDLGGHTGNLVGRERWPRSRPIDRRKLFVGGAAGEDHVSGEEHAVELRSLAFLEPVLERFGFRRDMVDDEIGHDLEVLPEGTDLGPAPEPGVDLGVIDRIETRIRAIDRREERQQMRTAERPAKRAAHDLTEADEIAGETIDVGDQLWCVAQWWRRHWPGVHRRDATF